MKNTSETIVERHIPCPSCPSSDAYCLYADGHGHCFSCNYHYFPDKKFEDLSFTYEFLPYRGISKNTYRRYNSQTKINAEGKPVSIGYPHREEGVYKVRSLDEKNFHYVGSPQRGCFGVNFFSPGMAKSITITEGYEDALSIYEVTGFPAVSVQSSGTAAADVAHDRAFINSYDRIYLAFDADERGREAAAAVAKLFDYGKVFEVRFPGGARKDANDYLQHGQHDELKQLWWNSKKYLPDTIKSSFVDFEKIINEEAKVGIAYPFPTLTYMTYGIRTGETVLITAQEGIGKTEVMHAIEYQLLRNTSAPIGAIFLEEPKKRHLQALAGIHLERPVHLPDCGVGNDKIFEAVQEVVGEDDRLHIYSHFGSDDPEHILDTIRFLVSARGCRYILLDHITMVVSGLGGENERRALDYLSTRLEMMVKELDFALILVSHVNDDGLTRGSRNISKVADIRINLNRDILSSDPVVRRTTNVSVSKNRFCGRTGPAGQLLFDPSTYTLKEDTGYDIQSANDNSRIEAMAAA